MTKLEISSGVDNLILAALFFSLHVVVAGFSVKETKQAHEMLHLQQMTVNVSLKHFLTVFLRFPPKYIKFIQPASVQAYMLTLKVNINPSLLPGHNMQQSKHVAVLWLGMMLWMQLVDWTIKGH